MRTQETEALGTSIIETSPDSSETALQSIEPTNGGVTVANGYEEEVSPSFVKELDDVGLTNSTIANGLSFIAQKATKTMSLGMGETLDVPDYKTRLAAFKLVMEGKGLLKEQVKVQRFDKSKIYVLQ